MLRITKEYKSYVFESQNDLHKYIDSTVTIPISAVYDRHTGLVSWHDLKPLVTRPTSCSPITWYQKKESGKKLQHRNKPAVVYVSLFQCTYLKSVICNMQYFIHSFKHLNPKKPGFILHLTATKTFTNKTPTIPHRLLFAQSLTKPNLICLNHFAASMLLYLYYHESDHCATNKMSTDQHPLIVNTNLLLQSLKIAATKH